MEHQEKSTVKTCPNCATPLPESAKYCQACGQKYTDGKISVASLLRESIDSIANLDLKIFRSLPNLFIPGKLTHIYFLGRHKRHVHPIRLFFLLAIIFLAILSGRAKKDSFRVSDLSDQIERRSYYEKFTTQHQALADSVRLTFPQPIVHSALDTLQVALEELSKNIGDSLDVNETLDFGENVEPLMLAYDDFANMPYDSIFHHYQVEGFWKQVFLKQRLKLIRDGGSFLGSIINKASWGILLMMPFLALILKLLYIRRQRYYMEHLIFSFHVHAFVFFLGILALLFGKSLPGFFAVFLSAGIPLYLLLAMRRFYKQSWLKTILKFLILSVVYIFLISIFALLTLVAGFFLF